MVRRLEIKFFEQFIIALFLLAKSLFLCGIALIVACPLLNQQECVLYTQGKSGYKGEKVVYGFACTF